MLEMLLGGGRKLDAVPVVGPGPKTLKAGNYTDGYYGDMPATDLFTASELATAVGITTGTLLNDDTTWFKISLDGKTLYTPRKPLRHGLSWNKLDALGIRTAAQNKLVTKNGFVFRVRLMTTVGPTWWSRTTIGDDPAGCEESEYNRIIYRLCVLQVPREKPPVFGVFTLDDLGLSLGDGCCVVGQEAGPEVGECLMRNTASGGNTWTALNARFPATNTDRYRGWRPVLELVG